MNTSSLTLALIMVAVALVLPEAPALAAQPCTQRACDAKYQNFLRKHILQKDFDRNSLQAWESYLREQQLWCRVTTQSFMENRQQVEAICSSGWRLSNNNNLCMSASHMEVYDVRTIKDQNGCRIEVRRASKPVIVACDKVGNRCLPVHFERFNDQQPTSIPC